MRFTKNNILLNTLKTTLFGILFIVSFIAFLPKENLYFYLLENLKTKNISIVNEKTTKNLFDFEILDATVKYHDIKALNIETTTISTYLFSTNINLENILFDGVNIEHLNINLSIFSPDIFNIKIGGKALSGHGTYDKNSKKLILFLKPTNQIVTKYGMIFSQTQTLNNGEYKLEYNL
jgi:hypothetical protein